MVAGIDLNQSRLRPGRQEVQLYYVGFEEYFLRSNIDLALSEYSNDAADRT